MVSLNSRIEPTVVTIRLKADVHLVVQASWNRRRMKVPPVEAVISAQWLTPCWSRGDNDVLRTRVSGVRSADCTFWGFGMSTCWQLYCRAVRHDTVEGAVGGD